jgi:hypothetical protein
MWPAIFASRDCGDEGVEEEKEDEDVLSKDGGGMLG